MDIFTIEGLANMNLIRLWINYNENSGEKPISYIEFVRQFNKYKESKKQEIICSGV